MDAVIQTVLASPWLLALLLVMVAVDGPLPFVPSEPILFAGAAQALAAGDLPMLGGLVLAAIAGSLLGDQLLYGMGRSSRRLLPEGRHRITQWVHRHLHARPIVALASVRIIPGGRLVSVAAAGRTALPRHRFLPASVASALLWTGYMTGMGVGLAGLTGGDPVWSIVASLALGATVAAICAVVARLRRLPAVT